MNERQALGQFYTPRTVIEFMFDVLGQLDPGIEQPWIIDPACGEGGFLLCARQRKLTDPARLVGMDVDPRVQPLWEHGGLAELPGMRIRDGLYLEDGDSDLPEGFDWVVGNPPFGGEGLSARLAEPESGPLVRALKLEYELWRRGAPMDPSSPLSSLEMRRLKTFPIEVLFLERFVQLAKPGGRVAIVLPDGILANTRMQYVRDWILRQTHVEAIVSLPRETFRETGTSAKTSILFLTKPEEGAISRPTMLASVDEIGLKDPRLNQLPYVVHRFPRRQAHGDGEIC